MNGKDRDMFNNLRIPQFMMIISRLLLVGLIAILLVEMANSMGAPDKGSKLDPNLLSLIKSCDDSRIPVIVEFYSSPTGKDIAKLEEEGFVLSRAFKIINAVSGSVPCGNITKIAEMDRVKMVWLNAKAHALQRTGPTRYSSGGNASADDRSVHGQSYSGLDSRKAALTSYNYFPPFATLCVLLVLVVIASLILILKRKRSSS